MQFFTPIRLLLTAATTMFAMSAIAQSPIAEAPLKVDGESAVGSIIQPRKVSAFPRQTQRMSSPAALNARVKAPMKAGADVPTIYGGLIYSDTWNVNDTHYGIYNFPASDPFELNLVKQGTSSMDVNGGGVYVDGRYYFINWFDTGGSMFAYYCIYDTYSWERISSKRVDITSIATDLTYSPVDESIYGCFINSSKDGYIFGRMRISDGSVNGIANLPNPLFFVAANAQGEIYGVDTAGYLYRIDRETGAQTQIGFTGILPRNSQSATFDMKTGRLYWAACSETAWGLYEVNTATAATTLITSFPNREEFGGLYIENQTAAATAPGEVSNLTAEYVVGTTADATLRFKLPSTYYDGSALTGQVQYVISFNDNDKDAGSGAAGSEVTLRVNNTSVGMTTIGVYTYNEAGKSPAQKVRLWLGVDNPKPVTNLKAEAGEGKVKLTWTAPTAGEHDGYFDASKLTYRIVRHPGEVLVAQNVTGTSYEDAVDTSTLSYYSYDVTPYMASTAGSTTSTEKIMVGQAIVPPYSESFTNKADTDLFTVLDSNNDGKTWVFESGAAKGAYSMTGPMDDWLITPPMQLESTNLYELRFKAHTVGYYEKFSVWVGTNNTAESMTLNLMPEISILERDYVSYKFDFVPEANGVYYIGFHQTSDAERFNLFIDDVELSISTAINTPAAVSNLKAIADPKGGRSVTVSFNAPTTTIGGSPLTSISRINVYRENKIITSIQSPAPGQACSYTDTAPELENNTYRVVAYNDEGMGQEITATVFVGVDIPLMPTNVRLVDNNGYAVLTWDAPTTGENGGFIDPDNLKYYIGVMKNGSMVPYKYDLTERTFSEIPEFENTQSVVAYYVFAGNSAGIGNGQVSNLLVMGTPYGLPFKESFSGNVIHYYAYGYIPENEFDESQWGTVEYGTLPTALPVDSDGGMLSFQPAYENVTSMFFTGRVDISTATNPMLEFYYYHKRNSGDSFDVQISTDGVEFETVKTIDMSTLDLNTGWQFVTIPLKAYVNRPFVQIALKVKKGNDMMNLHFDNFVIREVYDYDLTMVNLVVPEKYGVGREGTFTATVRNIGAKKVNAFTVQLFCNGNAVDAINGTAIDVYEEKSYTFRQIPDQSLGEKATYTAKVFSDRDQNNDNNEFSRSVAVIQPYYPEVTDLAASHDADKGTVTLTWSTPDMETAKRTTETFDNYEPFLIDHIGEWAVMDMDGGETAYFQGGYSWPNIGDPQAYIVYNTIVAGDGGDFFTPHSGDQMLVSFASQASRNNDWLLSPRLSGKAQTISFWVKSITDYYGLEQFEFWVTNQNFREDVSYYGTLDEWIWEAPTKWTKISIDLPDGATYFAIRCVSAQAYGFCIDDIEFTPAADTNLNFIGYDVYCNDAKLNATPLSTTTFQHTGVDATKSYRYNVKCVFDRGESAYSNTAFAGVAGIDGAESDGLFIATGRNTILLMGEAGVDFTVVAPDGRTVAAGVTDGQTAVTVQPGIYVVSAGSITRKVVVK